MRRWLAPLALMVPLTVAAGCAGKRSDPPLFVPWQRVGDISLRESKARVVAEYGTQPELGYRRHNGKVWVEYDGGYVIAIGFSTPYYRTKSGFGVGSRIPLGRCYRTATNRCEHRWHSFVWNAWWHEKPCSCWTKVGLGRTSLPATATNYGKPWFVINVKRARVTYFYFSLKYVD